MLLVIVKANLYGDNSFTTNGNFLVSNYGVKYNLLLTVNNIEILFKFKCGVVRLSVPRFWNTLHQINNTPHRTVYRERYNRTRWRVFVLPIPDAIEIYQISEQGFSETLSLIICRYPARQHDKVRKCFRLTTLFGVLHWQISDEYFGISKKYPPNRATVVSSLLSRRTKFLPKSVRTAGGRTPHRKSVRIRCRKLANSPYICRR